MDFSTQLSGLMNFGLYFVVSMVFMIAFKFLYTLATPHDEWKLIKEDKKAAAVAFGGSVLGFALALSGAASNSVSILDFSLWAIVALIAQLFAFALVRFMFMPRIVERIESDELSAGIVVAATSVSVGLLNAACMTY